MADIQIKVRVGTKLEKGEAAKLDPAKRGVLISASQPEPEVEGQMRYLGYTQCPWCGHIGRSILDTDVYLWFTCGGCGGDFRA